VVTVIISPESGNSFAENDHNKAVWMP